MVAPNKKSVLGDLFTNHSQKYFALTPHPPHYAPPLVFSDIFSLQPRTHTITPAV